MALPSVARAQTLTHSALPAMPAKKDKKVAEVAPPPIPVADEDAINKEFLLRLHKAYKAMRFAIVFVLISVSQIYIYVMHFYPEAVREHRIFQNIESAAPLDVSSDGGYKAGSSVWGFGPGGFARDLEALPPSLDNDVLDLLWFCSILEAWQMMISRQPSTTPPTRAAWRRRGDMKAHATFSGSWKVMVLPRELNTM